MLGWPVGVQAVPLHVILTLLAGTIWKAVSPSEGMPVHMCHALRAVGISRVTQSDTADECRCARQRCNTLFRRCACLEPSLKNAAVRRGAW